MNGNIYPVMVISTILLKGRKPGLARICKNKKSKGRKKQIGEGGRLGEGDVNVDRKYRKE